MNPWFVHRALTKAFLGRLCQSFPLIHSSSRFLSRAIRSLHSEYGSHVVSPNQERYLSTFPLVGNYFIHQPFAVFGLTKVIVGTSFASREKFIISCIECTQPGDMK